MKDPIEQEIQEKGLTAPRVTPEHIESVIVSEVYFTAGEAAQAMGLRGNVDGSLPIPAALHTLTFCVLTLRNGFTVTGESAPVSAENFDAGIGQKIARQNAVEKIWALEGYALKDRLSGSADMKPD